MAGVTDRPDRVATGNSAPALQRLQRGQHYSRFVGVMKIVLLLIGLGLVVLVVVWSQRGKIEEGVEFGFSKIEQTDTRSVRMINPRYVGSEDGKRPFELTADSATQVGRNSPMVVLDAIKGHITLEDGSSATLQAGTGLFNRRRQSVDLSSAVVLTTSQGYRFETERVYVDLDTGEASSENDVSVTGIMGKIEATGFRVSRSDHTLIFTGPVRTVVDTAAADQGQ